MIAAFCCLLNLFGQSKPALQRANPSLGREQAIRLASSTNSRNIARVTNRPANKMGRVMVVMYHHIANNSTGPMYRSREKFRRDLENLYKEGYRPVTMTEYVENRMKLPPGASPVVMTFDDSHPNQFAILKNGQVDPKCGVGIWMDFARTHPDFPVKATWFVLPILWGQHDLRKKKIDMLVAMGSEIGNHTIHHLDLRKLSDEKVKTEIGGMHKLLVDLGVNPKMPFCPPYGSYPKSPILMKMFRYQGGLVAHSSACYAGWRPSASPEDKKHFGRYKVDRVHGNGAKFGVDDWLAIAKAGGFKPYVAP
jgi:peptidoglycan/xylan/chitin deacetylase (PgdA/CDA1 family)